MLRQFSKVSFCLPLVIQSVNRSSLERLGDYCSFYSAINKGVDQRLGVGVGVDQQASVWNWGYQGKKGHASAPAPNAEEADKQQEKQSNGEEEQQQQEQEEEGVEKQQGKEREGINNQELIVQLRTQLQSKSERVDALNTQVSELKDKLLRTLADMENLRERTAKKSQEDKQFAVQDFAVGLLDVADNLERAIGAVSAEIQEGTDEQLEQMDKIQLLSQLRGLLGGVKLTERVLMQSFSKFGVSKFESLNTPFDPSLHNALFEVPDPSKESGIIAVVTKNGYKMHERVIRPADVGVARNATEQ